MTIDIIRLMSWLNLEQFAACHILLWLNTQTLPRTYSEKNGNFQQSFLHTEIYLWNLNLLLSFLTISVLSEVWVTQQKENLRMANIRLSLVYTHSTTSLKYIYMKCSFILGKRLRFITQRSWNTASHGETNDTFLVLTIWTRMKIQFLLRKGNSFMQKHSSENLLQTWNRKQVERDFIRYFNERFLHYAMIDLCVAVFSSEFTLESTQRRSSRLRLLLLA